MTDLTAAIERVFPSIRSEDQVGSLSGRWVGTADNREKNQSGSIVLTDVAAYVYKQRTMFNPESIYRIPLAAAQFDIKRNQVDRSGRTLLMWLDEVPAAEDQQTYLQAVQQNDFHTVDRVRKSAHRFVALQQEGVVLSMFVQKAISIWMERHQWRDAGSSSRIEFDRSLNEAGSSIPLSRDEMEKAQTWMQKKGVSLMEAQGRILDEREARA